MASPTRSAPAWADSGQGLGQLIAWLVRVRPLQHLLFSQARQLIIRTAERNGIPWRRRRQELLAAARPLLEASRDPAVQPPGYYLACFHAYEQGNLCWQAAAEAEQATDAMALRVWPEEKLQPAVAQRRLREAIFALIEPSLASPLREVLDLGCSVGVSTQALAGWLRRRQEGGGEQPPRVRGLDLSAHMLAVARVRDGQGLVDGWIHARAEDTGLPSGSIDLITLQFVCHELPQVATHGVLAEAARLLRPGGVLAMVDQDPGSAVLQRLPAPVATLLKSTEPYIEAYFRLDMAAALEAAGFRQLRAAACDPRHRVMVVNRQ